MKHVKDESGCQCAFSNTCYSLVKPTLCNCDSRGFNVTDVGILTSEQLPIYGVQYGGSITPYSSIRFDIGPFICSGKKGFYPSETEDIEKENLTLEINELKNEIKETKEDLYEISDQLEEHLRTTTTTTSTTTTTTTVPPSLAVLVLSNWSSSNKPMVLSFDGTFSNNFISAWM